MENLALALESQHAADGAARAIGGDQPVRPDRVIAVGRTDAQRDAVGLRLDADDFAAPAQLGLSKLAQAFDQKLLDPVLLQVDEGRAAVALSWQQVEFVDLLVTEIDSTDAPADALLNQALRAAKAVENLERAL